MVLYEQHRVDASIVLGVVCDLSILAPYNLARRRNQSQIRAVDLYDGPFCDYAQGRVERRLRVLFHSDELELERGLQFRVSNMRLFETQCCGPNKSLVSESGTNGTSEGRSGVWLSGSGYNICGE